MMRIEEICRALTFRNKQIAVVQRSGLELDLYLVVRRLGEGSLAVKGKAIETVRALHGPGLHRLRDRC